MEWSFGGIIGTIVFGAVIGILARFIRPGKQNISMVATVVIGIIGALVGYFVWGLISDQGDTPGIDWIRWIISIVVAIIGIGIYIGATAGKGRGGAIKK
ncbi:GlsB/YeaQ/YmgE family stress response membrane protein [Pseudactinotalea sp.]|uniref:GlsB/YeaQ/YmgE family stress response membrane protein n=1 Tax=Pseudactinotalea sp. TaxID=1926260 RepID=UPI003B3AA78B